jgi:hypothetical protein
MNDESITESPKSPACPVCATGFTATPGATCPACGRTFAPMPTPLAYDFRLPTERRRLDGPAWVVAGVVLLGGGLLLTPVAPGLLLPLALLLLPAHVRAVRLARGTVGRPNLVVRDTFLAALGVTLVTALAACVAGFTICVGTIGAGGGGLGMIGPGFIAGGVAAIVVFAGLFAALWPRADPAERRPDED